MSLVAPRADRPPARPSVASVGIIGAGIAGIGVAIELARRGIRVDLHERADEVHARASRVNEGKIHLGYTYANDRSLRTARLMMEGSWRFGPIVRDWLERDIDERSRSAPFHFLVHRDSVLDPATLGATYRRIAQLNREMAARIGSTYVGIDGDREPRRLTAAEREDRCGPDIVEAYETPEIGLDTEMLGDVLRRRVADDPRIGLRLGSEILSAEPGDGGVRVVARRDGDVETIRYDHVVNASWEDLLHLDGTAGLPPPVGASFRWRYVLRARSPQGGADIGSYSIALGAFGDVVSYAGGDLFLSWYPIGRRAMTTSLRPPAHWSLGAAEDAAEVRSGTIAALRRVVPALDTVDGASLEAAEVHAGVVYARGTSDIGDPDSRFHRRDEIGVRSLANYHSFDTGKYTMAPLFARRLATAIAGDRR